MEELFKDMGKIFVRTPLYSYQSLFDHNKQTKNLEELVGLRLNDPVFMEGLYWSSPQLYTAVLKFKEGKLKGFKENKLIGTLMKYLIRSATRCTPYGIYAGTAIADIGIQRKAENSVMERKVRIDMGLLQDIKLRLESDPAISPHLLYRVNTSLYSIPGQYRFIETIIENGKRHYQIASLGHTKLLEQIIGIAQRRLLPLKEIYNDLAKDLEYEEFDEFIKQLIKTQFLVSELEPALTIENEPERYRTILEHLTKDGISEAKKYLDLFLLIENILNHFLQLPVGVLPLAEIKNLSALLLECAIDVRQEHLFHADLKQPVPPGFVITKEQVKEIEKGISILGKLSTDFSPRVAELDCFKKLFLQKYESREIPLAEALDPEFGIGFPARDRIGDVAFNSLIEKVEAQLENDHKTKAENCQTWLQDKLESLDGAILQEGMLVTEEQLKGFDDKIGNLPANFSVMGSLLPSGKILLESVGCSHANSLLGRFAYLDMQMLSLCKQLADTEKENNSDVIFAEVICIPEGRIANIARRPLFTGYEIPFLATSGVKAERQILLNDLMISIQDNEIILRSKTLNQRIVPRLSNAHNYSASLIPAYKFLSSLQQQGKRGLVVNWGENGRKKRFLPRIAFKDIIIHRACWFLHKNEITTITRSDDPVSALRTFFLKWSVPRLVVFARGDNELLIDCSNSNYLKLFLEEIKSYDLVKLVEWLYDSDGNKYDKGKHVIQQFILPLFQKDPSPLQPSKKPETGICIQRTFEPGSEWMYFKIYCGATFSDNILVTVINPAISSLLKERAIKEAFFVRYTDPHYHIRFRLHLSGADNGQFARVIKCVYNLLHPLSAERIVWKVQLDTYQREVERYGNAYIVGSETVFFHDTVLFLNCLQDEEFAEDQQLRFLSAIKNVDRWLTLFNMMLPQKADYCLKMSDVLSKEFDPAVKVQVDLKYRELKSLLPSFLSSGLYDFVFNERDKNLKNILIRTENWASYIHMSLNRWFVNRQRVMEYMCYSFCSKYYQQLLHYNQ